jgi:hypothetical protein
MTNSWAFDRAYDDNVLFRHHQRRSPQIKTAKNLPSSLLQNVLVRGLGVSENQSYSNLITVTEQGVTPYVIGKLRSS